MLATRIIRRGGDDDDDDDDHSSTCEMIAPTVSRSGLFRHLFGALQSCQRPHAGSECGGGERCAPRL